MAFMKHVCDFLSIKYFKIPISLRRLRLKHLQTCKNETLLVIFNHCVFDSSITIFMVHCSRK